MAQHDYNIANQSGAAFRADLNNALLAIVSQNSGTSAPSTTFAHQFWADTTTGTLKIRNAANSAWIELMQLDGTLTMEDGTALLPGLAFRDDLNTGLFSDAADTLGISTGGVERVEFGTTAVVFNDGGNDVDFRIEGDTNANLFFVDAGNDRVGIGTSSPASTLDVSGNARIGAGSGGNFENAGTRLLIANTGGDAYIQVQSADTTGTSGIKFGRNSVANRAGIDWSASTDKLTFRTGGTSAAITVDNSQRVGIGTTSPASKCEIDVGATSDYCLELDSENSGDQNYIKFAAGTTFVGDLTRPTGTNNVALNAQVGSTVFQTGGTERARIDSSGRLLVGTSSAVASGTESIQAKGALSLYDPTASVAGSGQAINFRTDGGATGAIKASISGQNDSAYSYAGRLVFSTTADGASSPTEAMRITQAREVYIGRTTQDPLVGAGCKFQVQGTGGEWATIIRNANVSPYALRLVHSTDANNTSNIFLQCLGNTTQRAAIRANGGLANYSANNANLCDEREKKNIEALDSTWGCLKNWDLKKFHYNEDADTDDKRYGVIAQQVAPHCPEVITEWVKQDAADAVLDEDGNVVTPAREEIVRMGVKEQQMMWMAIKALQEAQTRIEELEAKVSALEAN